MEKSLEAKKAEAMKKARQYENQVKILLNKQRDAERTARNHRLIVHALAFSQIFNLLCERADNVHGGRLPHHVRVLWDEAANTGQVPNLAKRIFLLIACAFHAPRQSPMPQAFSAILHPSPAGRFGA